MVLKFGILGILGIRYIAVKLGKAPDHVAGTLPLEFHTLAGVANNGVVICRNSKAGLDPSAVSRH